MAEFDDGKDDGALRTIGEVSEALGIKPHVLRYWEQQFAPLNPLKRSGGRRYYRPSDVAVVETINRLVNEEGYTLKGAEAVLRAAPNSEHDRRSNDRRSTDRRSGSNARTAGQTGDSTLKPKIDAALPKLKALRAKLEVAIEA